jgi:2-polyprenyl-3-methyl-5-hydroxy-6-metoxy-1,4-benzoquinol methylase
VDSIEREVVFIIADISGYTRFIFSNQKEVSHSQIIIRELITTLLDAVDLPLKLARLEGDAIFFYALKDDPERPWTRMSKNLVINVMNLFKVFANKISELTLHKICTCAACRNIEQLKLKAVVHSGRTAFYDISGHQEMTGTDVIIVHRLLKNSVKASEYILLSEAAYNDLALPEGRVKQGSETYDEIGTINTYVYYPPAPPPYVPVPSAKPPTIFLETLRAEVTQEYAKVAQYPQLGFHFHTGRRLARMLDYREEWLKGFPDAAIESFAGTGNPFSMRPLNPGERVVDAGCGAGLDCLIASRMVGPSGEVTGVDMTPLMIEKARNNAYAIGARNAFFMEGLIEELPVPDEWADVVISNGAINLAPDKQAVFQELNRVLKPGGRLQIADILVEKPIPDNAKRNIDLWAG